MELGRGPFIFRELGCTGNYVRGAREQVHTFGVLGSAAKKGKNRDLGRSKIFLGIKGAQTPSYIGLLYQRE